MLRRFIGNKYVKPFTYVIAAKMVGDMTCSGYLLGREGFNYSSPAKLSTVPLGCVISGAVSVITSGIIITGAPFAIPMYTYNHFTDKTKNKPYHDLVKFAATMLKPNQV